MKTCKHTKDTLNSGEETHDLIHCFIQDYFLQFLRQTANILQDLPLQKKHLS